MNCKIPFTKDILFEKKVSEITSISLEHEITTEDNLLKGNFIVSGDFKSHEVSVNKEPFSYLLPFEIELAEEVDKDTIEFMIDDFTYEVVDNSILRVNIDFNVIADKKEIEEQEEESIFRDASELFGDEEKLEENEENRKVEELEETKEEKEEQVEKREDELMEARESISIQGSEAIVEEKTMEQKASEDTIINSIKDAHDEYTTYHIHMVNDGETVETICTMYNSNIGILSEYNDLKELSEGDKLIIPEKSE